MTVVAWDGQQLASDSAATSSLGTINRVCKIGLVEPTKPIPFIGHPVLVLFGVTGDQSGFMRVHEFLTGQTDKLDLKDKAEAIIACQDGAWLWAKDRPMPLIKDAKAAIGAGAQGALCAMFAGCNAARAVELVTAVVDSCEGPVQAFSLPVPDPSPPTEEPPELHEAQPEEPPQ